MKVMPQFYLAPVMTAEMIALLIISLLVVSTTQITAMTGDFQPNTNASSVYYNQTMVLGKNIKNIVILIPNEAHEPPGLLKELRVVNQPFLPQNIVANVGTTLVWFPVDIPHTHQVSVINEDSRPVFDSGVIKFNKASKPLKLNETGKFDFREDTKNPKYPNFILNGTITIIDQKSPSIARSGITNPDTIVTYMIPANQLNKRISEFKSMGFGVDSIYKFKSLRGGGSEAGGDTQEYLLVLTSSGKEINAVISALQGITKTMPYT